MPPRSSCICCAQYSGSVFRGWPEPGGPPHSRPGCPVCNAPSRGKVGTSPQPRELGPGRARLLPGVLSPAPVLRERQLSPHVGTGWTLSRTSAVAQGRCDRILVGQTDGAHPRTQQRTQGSQPRSRGLARGGHKETCGGGGVCLTSLPGLMLKCGQPDIPGAGG